MDVRCEKCQTEYELDEARLKPGGVTVKCTNCGHMFKIRKRTITNAGTGTSPPPSGAIGSSPTMQSGPVPIVARDPGARTRASSRPQPPARRDSILDDDLRGGADEAPTTIDRQWLIRLEHGEQKSCRELATLQQWIVAGVVTRESMISRTGKTWKRLGDIADLAQYFEIADEARANRDRARPAAKPAGIAPGMATKEIPGTIPGYSAAQAAGGTILPDDEDTNDVRTMRQAKSGRAGAHTPPPVPVRGAVRSPAPPAPPVSAPVGGDHGPAFGATEPVAPRLAPPTPPPLPPRRIGAATGPGGHAQVQPPAIPLPQGNRSTANWAKDGLKPDGTELPPSGPFVGKLAAIPDEPAFAGRVRMAPGDAASFDADRVRMIDEDDGVLPPRRGSRAGMWVLVAALLVMAAAAVGVYLFVLRTPSTDDTAGPGSGSAVATAGSGSAATGSAATGSAGEAQAGSGSAGDMAAVASARGELGPDIESRLRTAAQSLESKTDAASQAMRAHLLAQLAQDLNDRAALITTADADTLRRDARQLTLDAGTAAQRAFHAAGDDPGANVAMADVLRLQGKPARDVQRYLDTARARPDKDWAVEIALGDALVLVRDGKQEEGRAAFAAIDHGAGMLEASGDVRARFHLATALAALGKPADARPLVDAILAAQPEHAGARALSGKLETMVAKTDPLPPEEGSAAKPAGEPPAPARVPGKAAAATPPPARPATPRPAAAAAPAEGGGDSYERLLARGNAAAESNCTKAMDLYAKALEQKPNGVEALAGMGYCHIDAKQFASAFSKFRAALAVSPRYEPALRGIAEAYQQQGRKEQAIEAYKAYLEVYPDSAAAKKQLERLGGGDSAAPPPPAPSSPPPTPAADPGAGTGSG